MWVVGSDLGDFDFVYGVSSNGFGIFRIVEFYQNLFFWECYGFQFCKYYW